MACSSDVNGPDSTTSVDTVPVSAARTSSHVSSRERECGARESHDDEERGVPAPPADAVARASDRDRRERDAGEQCREDDPDLEAGEPAAGERDADEDAAEPIGERP